MVSVAVLGALIAIHETGHFLAARWQGIKVSSFSIGFGPVLFQLQRGGVQYALRAIPMGGFVAFPDDTDEEGEEVVNPADPDLLGNRPLPQRAVVIVAGVVANLLLAWVVLLAQGAVYGVPDGISADEGVVITAIAPGSAAASAGLSPGEQVVGVGDRSLGAGDGAVQRLVTAIQAHPAAPLPLLVEGGDGERTVMVTPSLDGGVGRIGATLQPSGVSRYRPARWPSEWIVAGSRSFWQIACQTVAGYANLATHFQATAQNMGGPVRIVEMGARFSQQGGASLLFFTALISINLAVLNALPLPALDGGQLLLLLCEGLRGQPLPDRFTATVTNLGFSLLAGLVGVLVVHDTLQLDMVRQWMGH